MPVDPESIIRWLVSAILAAKDQEDINRIIPVLRGAMQDYISKESLEKQRVTFWSFVPIDDTPCQESTGVTSR